MTLQQKMISEMFKRIKRGPGRDDMIIYSKKHFMDCGGGKKKFNEIHVFHWHLNDLRNLSNKKSKYHILFYDNENFYFSDKYAIFLAEGFDSWKEAFEWLTEYLLVNEF